MKINNSYILLKDICCFAYHGVAPQENIIGNEYIINLKLKVDISQAIQTDDVVDTVNYAEIHEAVKAEMSIPSKLLEHVCGRIAKRLLAEFPAIEEIELRLSKRNPPMGADIDSAGVELHCSSLHRTADAGAFSSGIWKSAPPGGFRAIQRDTFLSYLSFRS